MKQIWHYHFWLLPADIRGISPLWRLDKGDPFHTAFTLEFELITMQGTVRFKSDQLSGLEIQSNKAQVEKFNAYTKEYKDFRDWVVAQKS